MANEFKGRNKRKGGSIEKGVRTEYFKKLLGSEKGRVEAKEKEGKIRKIEENEEGIEKLDKEITMSEVGEALKRVKNRKVTGEDGIVLSFLNIYRGTGRTKLPK